MFGSLTLSIIPRWYSARLVNRRCLCPANAGNGFFKRGRRTDLRCDQDTAKGASGQGSAILAGPTGTAATTTLHKVFAGRTTFNRLRLPNKPQPSRSASRPCRIILCDEVDPRYSHFGGLLRVNPVRPQGQAAKCQHSLEPARSILVSTPTEKGASRIEQAYEESDKRKYFCAMPRLGGGASAPEMVAGSMVGQRSCIR